MTRNFPYCLVIIPIWETLWLSIPPFAHDKMIHEEGFFLPWLIYRLCELLSGFFFLMLVLSHIWWHWHHWLRLDGSSCFWTFCIPFSFGGVNNLVSQLCNLVPFQPTSQCSPFCWFYTHEDGNNSFNNVFWLIDLCIFLSPWGFGWRCMQHA